MLLPQETDWALATTNVLLFIVSVVAFQHARKVNVGSAAAFLLQACAAALGAVCHCSGDLAPLLRRSQREAAWASAVLGPAVFAFAFHWSNRDRLAANSVLTGALLAAACSDPLAGGGQCPAVRAAMAAALLSVLTVSLFTVNGWGVAGSLLGLLAGELPPAGLLGLRSPCGQNLLLVASTVALQRALGAQDSAELV
ncbi:transmembrane protein 276-like [Hypanus sabinus]|uniref:transmembrane protein 276-like n=1 Tax=Hypanus sabinus TaxID=79690 RepID=UPI0028C3AACC|nr:transmembrane protein 276-like [Hypanus sabinus]